MAKAAAKRAPRRAAARTPKKAAAGSRKAGSDPRGFRALAPATAGDEEQSFFIAREFEQHMTRERSQATGVQYRRAFLRRFEADKRTLVAMASDKYLGSVRCRKGSFVDAASIRAFGAFWNQRQAGAPFPPVASAARSLEAASAQDRARFPVVMRSFEKHLDKEYEKSTSSTYRRALHQLFEEDGKSLDTMASDSYEQALKRQQKHRLLRASAKAFKRFFAKRGNVADKCDIAEKPDVAETPAEKIKRPSHFSVKGGVEEANDIARRLKPWIDHLINERGPNTAKTYAVSFRTLIRRDRKSLDAMATPEYVESVRTKGLCFAYPAAAASYYKYRHPDKAEQGGREAERKRKSAPSATDSQEDAGRAGKRLKAFGILKLSKVIFKETGQSDSSAECPELQPFLAHLRRKQPKASVKAYSHALRKLIRLHGKSLDFMATQEYVDRVRRLNWSRVYAAALMALSRFRGAEFTRPHGDAAAEPGKQEAPKKDGKKDASDARTHDKQEQGNASQGLQPFLDHLHSEKNRLTAKQYGQVIRKLVKVHGQPLDTMASEEYLDRVRKMNWSHKYPAAVRALCKFRSGVAMGHSELREQANEEAQRRMVAAHARSRPVSDGDILAVLRLWPFEKNINRLNVMPKGTEWVHSATVGIIGDRRGRTIISNATVGSEDVVRLLCQWFEHQLGVGFGGKPFPVTSININKGYAAARHRDKSNQGPSAIRAFGNSQDGLLRYWPNAAADMDVNKLRDEDSVLLDPRHELVLFDGNRPHAVTPFSGERFSVVFFTSSRHPRAAPSSRAAARKLGMRWPTAHLLASAKAMVA